MAEFLPTPPEDPAEAAYRRALLGDDDGREARRARLMAALPRPPAPAEAVPVARGLLARRWSPQVLGLLAMVLLLAVALLWRGRAVEPRPQVDARVAAGPAASAPVVVAQAPAVAAAERALPEVPPAAAKRVAPPAVREVPRASAADAAKPAAPPPLLAQAPAESTVPVVEAVPRAAPPPPPPAAPVIVAAAPAPAPAAPAIMAESRAPSADMRARVEAPPSAPAPAKSALAQSLAASDAASALTRPTSLADARLSRAVAGSDPAAVREALQVGADVQARDAQGRTLLMQAARTGSREVVDLLLAAGLRKTDRDPAGWTAADHAQAQGHVELAAHLR
jgi:hypothetical protein